jgi:hypothetical protein
MTISPELAMVDTNVLTYAYCEDAPHVAPRFPYLTVPKRPAVSLCDPPGAGRVLCGYHQSPLRLQAIACSRHLRLPSGGIWRHSPASRSQPARPLRDSSRSSLRIPAIVWGA